MSPRSILIVDDDEEIREALSDALIFEGWDVAVARDGQDAVNWLRAQTATPWLIILDLMMPVMDGKTFLDLRAQDALLATYPVIVLTAGGDCREVRDRNIAFCFPKTIKLPDLLAAINACA